MTVPFSAPNSNLPDLLNRDGLIDKQNWPDYSRLFPARLRAISFTPEAKAGTKVWESYAFQFVGDDSVRVALPNSEVPENKKRCVLRANLPSARWPSGPTKCFWDRYSSKVLPKLLLLKAVVNSFCITNNTMKREYRFLLIPSTR